MTAYKLEIFADYNQVYLHDESAEADFADSWDDKAYKNMAAVIDGAIGVATARNMDVPVEVLICESEQPLDIEAWEHAVSCGVELCSGVLVVRGPSDYLPDAKRINVKPGYYAAHILYKGLNTLSEDGLEGGDYYRIVLWLSATTVELKLLKDSGFNGQS
ncbi:hypothetical protein OE749_02610 [Aestuariibacter sp. AA17]|uniref:Uncharacterized protein n=1 Tax=Fluctibacter corallii TaxID=2984329 RepID=A0ABT3A4I3_9ALTE|nr:hypothetical protein [Aestuariibacter sp. AA17]MCV2883590.1 hypothetical protein [Aestuariibacter sp. AA17]